jgi:hypothetical protein
MGCYFSVKVRLSLPTGLASHYPDLVACGRHKMGKATSVTVNDRMLTDRGAPVDSAEVR